MRVASEETLRCHDLARYAHAALDGTGIEERSLQIVEAIGRKTFDRGDRGIRSFETQDQTGVDDLSIEEDRARPTFAIGTALLRARVYFQLPL